MTSATFCDANVLVYANTRAPQSDSARKILLVCTHTDALALTEAFSKIRTIENHDHARASLRRVLGFLDVIPVTSSVVFDATKRQDLDIFDAIHAVCAEGMTLKTFDKDLAKATGNQVLT